MACRRNGRRWPPPASNPAAVVGPMEQGLALSPAAGEIARVAMPLDLADMAAHCFPALDLACILFGQPAAPVIAAVPLKPAARIVRMDPALLAPYRHWLARIDAEIIQGAIALLAGELG